jgi:hypothetical protein
MIDIWDGNSPLVKDWILLIKFEIIAILLAKLHWILPIILEKFAFQDHLKKGF